jgi:hypothetical protein
MNEQMVSGGYESDPKGKLAVSDGDRESRQVLSDRDEFSQDEQRILDVLTRGLSREFPNPDRVGCPGSTVLRGIAFRKLRLAEVGQWLDHLSSCSPCFQEFTELRSQAASRQRRTQLWLAAAAILILAVAGWLWVRTQHAPQPPQTAVLDLHELSVTRGENPTQAGQRPLELRRSAKHLVVDLPIGSKEGTYDLALLSNTGDQLLSAAGTAQLQDHLMVLRAEIDASGVSPGLYILALRQPGLEWSRYPIRVF